jgi:hypothetical protein
LFFVVDGAIWARMAAAAPDTRRGLSRGLSHPAALLLLTAVLTGLLVPWITNRWEARDKEVEEQRVAAERELEVKSAIVSRIAPRPRSS